MKPSIEQQKVLDVKDKNIIVSASAGNGKTTVMTTKIKNFILEGNSVKDILVLTYTKASATEMKLKLEKSLMESESEFATSQVEDLSTADISTFHAFCQKLIKRYFYVLGISPNFDILEDLQQKTLLDKSYNDAIKQVSKQNEEDYVLTLETFFSGRNDNSLRDMVFSLKDFFDSSLNENFCQNTFDFLNGDFALNYIDNHIKQNIVYYYNTLENLQKKSKEYGFDRYVAYINAILSQLSGILHVEFVEKLKLIENLDFGVLRKEKQDEIDFNDKINILKTNLKKFTDKIKEKEYQNFELVKQNSIKIATILFSICDNLKLFYTDRKKELNKLDYSDLERYTLKLLEDINVRNYLKEKYKLIFIDEFQDANEIQEKIISLLAKSNNRFMVGDVKQSIYAFRQSNPDIFLQIEENYKKYNQQSVALTLNDNYRSDKNILDFVNIVFSKIMTKQTSGIDYKNNAMFNGKAQYKKPFTKQVNVDIIQTLKTEKIKYTGVYSVKDTKLLDEEDSLAEKEANIVANRIYELIGKEIYDKELGTYRPVKYEDICILLRNRGNYQKVFASTLSEAGIPLSVNSNSFLFETFEGKICLNFLKYINNSQDDICLVSTLINFFDFTEQDLADIRLYSQEEKHFFEAFKKYKKQGNILAKIDNFNNLIHKFKCDLEFLGLHDALNNLLRETKTFEKCSNHLDSGRRILNFNTFLNLIKKDISLGEFLSYNLSPNVVNICKDSSVVNITTIHSSKGLEYPIVFVCNLGADFNRDKKNSNLIISKNYGLASKVADTVNSKAISSVYFDCLKLINKSEDFAEKIRLLYVAMTRAKNNLYLVATKTNLDFAEFNSQFEIINSNSYIDLIINSLDQKIIDNFLKNKTYQEEFLNMQIHMENEIVDSEEKDNFVLTTVKNSYVNKFSDYLNFKPTSNNIAFKNSVSALNNEEYTSVNLKPEKLTINEHLQTESSDKGTRIHKVLELVDFEKINSLEDLKLWLQFFYDNKQIDSLDFDFEKLYNNITVLKNICKGKILKEKTFVMKVRYSDVVDSTFADKILVQGIVDLIILGKNNIVIDYKLTSILDDEKLIKTYFKQLKLYKMAVEKSFNICVDEVYIFNLNKNKLIPVKI